MKKISLILLGLLATLNLNAASNELYKDIKAGDNLSKHLDLKTNPKAQVDCKLINVPLLAISECFIVSINENFSGENNFLLAVSTINKKINTAHLLKVKQQGPLESNLLFWQNLFDNGLKGYDVFDTERQVSLKKELKNMTDFQKLQISEYHIASNKNKNFIIDNVLFDTKEVGEFDFAYILKNEPTKLVRSFELLDAYDSVTNTWTYRIDITNFNIQKVLQDEYLRNEKKQKF